MKIKCNYMNNKTYPETGELKKKTKKMVNFNYNTN